MADTVYYNTTGDSLAHDRLTTAGQSAIQKQEHDFAPLHKKEDGSEYYAAFVWVSVIVFGFILVRRALNAKGTTLLGGSWDDDPVTLQDELRREYHIYNGNELEFSDDQFQKILSAHSHYFRRLSPELKDVFQKRVQRFMQSKTFLVKGDDVYAEMPVLLSAAAVQLTFGLDKYLLPHYNYIRVFQQEYFAKGSLRVLAGHVYGNTITIAWNQFLKGNIIYTDGVNVGLHEMAHALYFQLVEADSGNCRKFESNFKLLMEEGEEMYALKHSNPSELFSKNAFRNLQEFWAESVELFFERPLELKRYNQDLYAALTSILLQDPLHSLYPIPG